MSLNANSAAFRAVLVGGAVASVLDGLDAIVAFKAVLGFDPIPIYQFVASGLLGPSAFQGGLAVALFGLAIHTLIAFTAAAAYVLASRRLPALRDHASATGLAFGVLVYAFMTWIVVPLSRIPPAPFSLPLFLNGIVGHALFVGLPIAWSARYYLDAGASAGARRTIAGTA